MSSPSSSVLIIAPTMERKILSRTEIRPVEIRGGRDDRLRKSSTHPAQFAGWIEPPRRASSAKIITLSRSAATSAAEVLPGQMNTRRPARLHHQF
jgi:hypothetical protein